MPQPPANPHAALPEEATLVRKAVGARQRRIAEVADSVFENGRLKVMVNVKETGGAVVATKTIYPGAIVLSDRPEDEGITVLDTALEKVLIEYDWELKAADIKGHQRPF